MAAAHNYRWEVMELLFDQRGASLPISKEVVIALAAHRSGGVHLMRLLFDQTRDIPISEEAVEQAASNQGCGPKLIQLLFDCEGERLPFSEKVVMKAAGNKSMGMK
jgi:hypothetical protein